MKTIISFLVPVYNQSELLKRWLEVCTQYKGNDIEIVVSDDGSTDGIEDVVKVFADDRIKLYQNNTRKGQDLNILAGIKKCVGEYIYLFRTKDFVIPETIPKIISECCNGYSFITGTAINEDGKIIEGSWYKEDETIEKGLDALQRHYKLYIHPSGFLFKRDFVDADYFEDFLNKEADTKHFVFLSDMIRLRLSQCGDYRLLKETTWIYTQRSDTVSANVGKKFIHDFEYNYMSFEVEFKYSNELLNGYERSYSAARIFGNYLKLCTWSQIDMYSNEEYVRHHNLDTSRTFNLDVERNNYLEVVVKLEKELGFDKDKNYQELKNKYIGMNKEFCDRLKRISRLVEV